MRIILVGNKLDLSDSREVKDWEFEDKAKNIQVKCFETSAKDGTNIQESFEYIINEVLESMYKRPKNPSFGLYKHEEEDSGISKKCICNK